MMLKNLIIIVLFTICSNATNLKEFVDDYVNRSNNAVVLDPKYNDYDIKVSDTYYTSSNVELLTKNFKLILVDNGYLVQLNDNIMYITNTNDVTVSTGTSSVGLSSQNPNSKQYIYDPKYITIDDLQTSLSSFVGVDIKYLKSYNQVIFICDTKDYTKIMKIINHLDVPIKSKNIKITIFNSSDDISTEIGTKINKLGLSLNSNVSNDIKYFDYLFEFSAYIKALKDDNKINISQSPTFYLINGNKLTFKSVKNIPYLTQSAEVSNTNSSTTNTYAYKDVGLQVDILPKISKKSTLLDVNIKLEDLLDLNGDKPVSSRLEYQNTIVLNNVPVLLTGLKKTIKSNNIVSIPLLSDIPLLGNIFKFKNDIDSSSNMSILIEFLPNNLKDN